mmetsp:Transcript_98334/g.249583  ORF Transcript_98334/g.249583 Transcript_98334/m.249583 type:complete len:101 (-) Transcript_98334:72-374(-)
MGPQKKVAKKPDSCYHEAAAHCPPTAQVAHCSPAAEVAQQMHGQPALGRCQKIHSVSSSPRHLWDCNSACAVSSRPAGTQARNMSQSGIGNNLHGQADHK